MEQCTEAYFYPLDSVELFFGRHITSLEASNYLRQKSVMEFFVVKPNHSLIN